MLAIATIIILIILIILVNTHSMLGTALDVEYTERKDTAPFLKELTGWALKELQL